MRRAWGGVRKVGWASGGLTTAELKAHPWTAAQRLLPSTFGCGTHGDRYQAVVRQSVNTLDECRLSGEQPPVSRRVPHHHYL